MGKVVRRVRMYISAHVNTDHDTCMRVMSNVNNMASRTPIFLPTFPSVSPTYTYEQIRTK